MHCFMNTKSIVAIVLAGLGCAAQAQTPSGVANVANVANAAAVQKLASGVEVTHLKVGAGGKPTATSTVRVHYEGKLADGTVFDSSYRRGQPISFALNQVIACWTQGLQTMAVGGKAVLRCPAQTAYGSRGAGGVIPPNAELTFTVELLGIEG